MAAAALRALRVIRESGTVLSARLSLARTVELLKRAPLNKTPEAFSSEDRRDIAPGVEPTYWWPAQRIRFPVVEGLQAPNWPLPARPLHSDASQWSSYLLPAIVQECQNSELFVRMSVEIHIT
ncbi:MAG: hypothetical protein ACI8RN_000225 [Glaciecola sp.]|jgi:hypothetical protein|uniref:hypothetical protein n=1 Tax=Congregibacter sp. TaxID=2744308 RepID=UPI0039E4D1CB